MDKLFPTDGAQNRAISPVMQAVLDALDEQLAPSTEVTKVAQQAMSTLTSTIIQVPSALRFTDAHVKKSARELFENPTELARLMGLSLKPARY